MRNLYLVSGPSASGKTVTVKCIEKMFGVKRACSWTTRAPRYEGESDYTFVSPEQFHARKDMTAYGMYAGNEYGIPVSVLKESDIYIVEPNGIKALKTEFPDMNIKVILFGVSAELCEKRMRSRGDNEENIQMRLATDKKVFGRGSEIWEMADSVFHVQENKTVEDTAKELYTLICSHELMAANEELQGKYPGIGVWLFMIDDNVPNSMPQYCFSVEDYYSPTFSNAEEVYAAVCDYLETPYLRVLNQIEPKTQNGSKLIHVARAALPMNYRYCKTGDMAFVKRFVRLCPNIVADEMYSGEEDLLAQNLTMEQRTAVEEAFSAIEYMHRLWYNSKVVTEGGDAKNECSNKET